MRSEIEQLTDLQRGLVFVGPSERQTQEIQDLEVETLRLGALIIGTCPDGRERDLALVALEEAAMWATKAIIVRWPDSRGTKEGR